MTLKDTYRNMILDRVQSKTGFSLERQAVPPRQWRRISELSEILHESIVLEQMIKVESKKSRSFSSRFSSKIRPAKAAELDKSLEALENVKKDIWEKCDSVAYDILSEKELSDEEQETMDARASPGIMRCRTCGGSVTILAYNNYKCTKCGLGYSAKDYLEIIRNDVSGI